ncbi:hypothetical protein E2C01_009855 [Portunus trituberculatus]|uniref:Uncharacterized protein n=1 Tax=Portunus trituberculatus TaxID=210409 RepID=A0A5B7D6T9_PORTR|nr:hypothetical protein [Portunus trituberculatus]
MEREIRYMKEVMSSMMEKQDKFIKENTELKVRLVECEKIREIYYEMEKIKKQNDDFFTNL